MVESGGTARVPVVGRSYARRVTSPGGGDPARSHAVTGGVLRGRLFLTSYAPLFAILAARTAPGIGDSGEPLWPFMASAALMCIGLGDGWFLLRGAARRGAIEVTPTRVEEQGAAAAGYLPTYLLPFIGPNPGTVGGWIGYGIYLAVLFVVFLSSDFALVNPTLYVLGRRVVRVARNVRPVDPSAEAHEELLLVVTRNIPIPGRPINLTRLSGCWVEKES